MDSDKAFRLDGRVALVTGSTRGLGKQIAIDLAKGGAKVAMNYANSRETAEAAFAELQAVGGDCCLVQGDVTDQAEVERMCGEIAGELGPVDILVLNATCAQPELTIEEYEWDFYQRMLDFFVKSPVLFTKACLPHMKQQRWGRIIHITSEVLAMANAPFSAYVAAKGGQTGLALSCARELASSGITVNMIAPGWIPVERHEEAPAEAMANYAAGVPAGHQGVPGDVAPAVRYLASSESQFVTGQTISVNGGNSVLRSAVGETAHAFRVDGPV
ncbi:3-oxoacyl-[acyl-carrier-protein] reductase FabG [Posidoniimonas polymericola]|uniref:3-oxoacyl-[acyl-carrier-protein] reductase FabG n=1 Tax=Posidoniimonas polymericola TaxID=2528002 RepID=A0A5C5YES3_9BACT|nr:SDR family oxidoreductase [Posidoniimonas polymericola]TWT73429.1 3-oxoacyl-[acyl-carrier-protein] reductase FabG [Posidoniimonas polymericola]